MLILLTAAAGLLQMRVSPVHAQGPDDITPTLETPRRGTLYEPLEWTLAVNLSYDNPFDPDDIDVFGVFTSPDGYQSIVTAFWMQPLEQVCQEDCAIEVLEPVGEPEWRLRFTPTLPGTWAYLFQARQGADVITLGSGQLEVVDGEEKGFIRVADNGRYFTFEDRDEAYFPIGHNLAWSWNGAGGVFAYQRWLQDLAANGGNYARLYVDVPWFIGFEWTSPVGDYTAAQEDFWRLDTILETAAQEGVYLDVVILWHQALANHTSPPVLVPSWPPRVDTSVDWRRNPYNVLNGGSLTSTTQFFTEESARALFQRRLRYLVARWGYSPNIFAWDLLSSADRVVGYNDAILVPWLDEMAAYLHAIDPYDHLITVGAADLTPELLAAPGLDFGQARVYQRRPLADPGDHVADVIRRIQDSLRLAARPLLLTEFSLNPWYEPVEDDPTGIHIRNTMWASIFAGAAGSGGSWWWNTYLEPEGLLVIYRPLARFTADIPWHRLQLVAVQARLVSPNSQDYAPLRLDNYDRRFMTDELPDLGDYLVTPDGVFPALDTLSSYIFGQRFHDQFSRPHSYLIAPPVDTRLTVGVRSVSPQLGATLVVRADGVQLAEVALAPGASTTAITVPLAAGEHLLELDNAGDDWLQIDHVTLEHYITPLRVMALVDYDQGLLLAWFQNRAYQWQTPDDSIAPLSPDVRAKFSHMPAGEYRVEFWDPISGQIIGEDRVQVREEDNRLLTLNLLPISRLLAVRVLPVEGLALSSPTPTPIRPTATPQPSLTPTWTPAPTETPTEAPTETTTATSTDLPTATSMPTTVRTVTPEPSASPTPSATSMLAETSANSRTPSPAPTLTPIWTPTTTAIPTNTAAPSSTAILTTATAATRTPRPTASGQPD